MIYLDYSATTPVNEEVLDSFNKACLEFPGNANSLHTLGVRANKLVESETDPTKFTSEQKQNAIKQTFSDIEREMIWLNAKRLLILFRLYVKRFRFLNGLLLATTFAFMPCIARAESIWTATCTCTRTLIRF